MAQVVINLPSINGEIEAGITVGVDSSLPDDRKLPIATAGANPLPIATVKSVAGNWAMNQFQDATAKKMFVNGVLGIIDTGLICEAEFSDIPDGDWQKLGTVKKVTAEEQRALEAIANRDEMMRGITIALATKANYWLMNHHTGQGAVAGYVKKVLEVFYPNMVSEQVVSAAHNLGHYVSTLKVLSMAGITNVRNAIPFVINDGAAIKLSDDAKLRFQSMPAGTHRLAIAFEAAKRMVRTVYAAFCPNVEDFISLPEIRDRVIANPASYHIGASYITGTPRSDYQDTDMNNYLGRLGTFITVLYKQSTLAKSPHLAVPRVESYDDYDADFKAILGRITAAQAQARGRLVEEQIQEFMAAPRELVQRIRAAYAPARVNAN